MNLSKNFTLDELIVTSTGLTNEPFQREVHNLERLCVSLLQIVRDRWGRIKVTSGFRSEKVEKVVAKSGYLVFLASHKLADGPEAWAAYYKNKQHPKGEAADFIPLDAAMDTVYRWIVCESGLQFGQCIRESAGGSDWIHLSLPREGKMNNEALVYKNGVYVPYEVK